jgi:AraC-like DNA-binding protein
VTLSRCQVSRSSRTITAIFVSKRTASSMPGEGRPLLYVRDVTRGTVVRAWVPDVPGIAEAFHTRFTDHVYPPHAHDTWTLMIVDDGAVRYDLHRHERGAPSGTVVLLPPDIAHTDRSATPAGFRKRVLYLDADVVDTALAGRVVDEPTLADDLLHTRLDQLHRVLDEPDGALEAESRLALIGDRIARRLGRPPSPRPPGLAQALRDLLDSRLADGVTLRDAGALLHADPAHLVRSFGREFGLPPHRYLVGRRVEAARWLLDGEPIADVAAAVGYDQSHLHRHFTGLVGITPRRFAARA